LELFCESQFYGPLVIALNSEQTPYELHSFNERFLNIVSKYNKSHNKTYPPPIQMTPQIRNPEGTPSPQSYSPGKDFYNIVQECIKVVLVLQEDRTQEELLQLI